MLKASAGGGGKGMRVAWNDDETRCALIRCYCMQGDFLGKDLCWLKRRLKLLSRMIDC